MTDITRDDIRAAVGAGMMSEALAASLLSLADTRRGVRSHMSGLDEPFELFRGFNEIFIVVGMAILYMGWAGLTGLSILALEQGYSRALGFSVIGMVASVLLARYFTLTRRMVAPSIALVIFFALNAVQFSVALAAAFDVEFGGIFITIGVVGTALLCGYYLWFRVPFAAALIAIGVFVTLFSLLGNLDQNQRDISDLFLLTADGPFALVTILVGIATFAVAMRFDMSDPHRLTRRSATGFWLHVIAAPAIVNTVALSLLDIDTFATQMLLIAFIGFIALMAIVIDRRSFLVSGVGYIVALSITLMEGQAFTVILILGMGLITLGAKWEAIRGAIMRRLPEFKGKDRLPPWAAIETPQEISS